MAYDIDGMIAGEPLQYWVKNDIRPFQTRTICRAVIVGHAMENSTNFLRVTGTLLDDNGQGERSQPQMFSVYQYLLNGKLEFETLYVDRGDPTGIYMEFASTPPIAVMPGKNAQPGKPSDLVK
ncbi:hypothetical protein ANCDUO_19072, partial [Ancylostoma duodenale]